MSVVILDAMDREDRLLNILKNMLEEKGEEIHDFKLVDKKIAPCRSCGSCAFITPGKCVINDDMHEILRATAKCRTIILLTPIRFGGYPSSLKKAMDKIALLVLPSYTVKKGHLLHPPRYGSKALLGIGVLDRITDEQETSFKRLVGNNALNLQFPYKALVLKSTENIDSIKNEMNHAIEEVC